MGWYGAVGRPLFFALPPEASHRLALSLLRLPLPWRSIGGAAQDPSLRTELAGIELRNPIGLAAGFDKDCRVLGALGSLGFGYVVGGTVTRRPRAGRAKPRIVRIPGQRAIVNAMGMPNEGAEAVARHLAALRKTAPVIVSIAAEERRDVLAVRDLLEPHVDGFELNPSSPNASWGRDRGEGEFLGPLVESVAAGAKPLFVKLPPYSDDSGLESVVKTARLCVDRGAAGLTCSNSLPVEDSRVARGRGGLTGRPLFPRTPAVVEEVVEATGGAVPVNACGGIFSAADARACLDAGARTVQIYTGLVYEGPGILRELTRGLASVPAARRSARLRDA